MDFSALAQAFGPLTQRLQQQEAERAQAVIEGSAGGGACRVRLGGALDVRGVQIAPAAAQAAAADPHLLEDLVAAALADALAQWRARFGATPQEQMQRLMGGMDPSALLGAFGKR